MIVELDIRALRGNGSANGLTFSSRIFHVKSDQRDVCIFEVTKATGGVPEIQLPNEMYPQKLLEGDTFLILGEQSNAPTCPKDSDTSEIVAAGRHIWLYPPSIYLIFFTGFY